MHSDVKLRIRLVLTTITIIFVAELGNRFWIKTINVSPRPSNRGDDTTVGITEADEDTAVAEADEVV